MFLELSVARSFDASHKVPSPARCARRHGHRWTVTVTQISEVTPNHSPIDIDKLEGKLDMVIGELANRDLNEMTGVSSTVDGLAWYIRERLAQWFPGLSVEVAESTGLSALAR